MAGRGRARGRARGILDVDLSKPGGLASKNDDDDDDGSETVPESNHSSDVKNTSGSNDIGDGLAASNGGNGNSSGSRQATLSLNDIKSILEDSRTYNEQNDVKHVLLCARNYVRTEDDVKTLASLIYNKCLEDASLAKRGSEICDGLTSIEIGNTKFRNCLLGLVQTDYKARADLIAQNLTRFNGFLAFLCEIFDIMRTTTNEVFKPLVTPIYDCFNLVLGPDEGEDAQDKVGGGEVEVNEDACENLSIQLQAVGRLLEDNSEEQMKQLMNRIRTCIINSKCSPRARCCLLEVVECYARGWEAASNDTTRYYCDMAVGIISGLVL